ncbi:MAG: metal-dependent transcriptional regulator [Bacillales bacterium]|jgi:Mn-dependent DtxR family transcriptional regulator|nr:metal-dependent transcriptional regulator [Bacillales bacterium]
MTISNTNKESSEDYLEAILSLSLEKKEVRATDIVKYLNFTKPSVSVALKKLKEKKLIEINPKNFISLTDEGLKIASSTYERHLIISRFFTTIGVSEEIALQDACKIEHDLHQETYLKLKEYLEKKLGIICK